MKIGIGLLALILSALQRRRMGLGAGIEAMLGRRNLAAWKVSLAVFLDAAK